MRLFRDVYVNTDDPVDDRVRIERAALLLPQGAVIGGRSALSLCGIPEVVEHHRVAVECEGCWHWEPGQLRRDRQRLDRLTAAGWRVIHVTAQDLREPIRLVARIQPRTGERPVGDPRLRWPLRRPVRYGRRGGRAAPRPVRRPLWPRR